MLLPIHLSQTVQKYHSIHVIDVALRMLADWLKARLNQIYYKQALKKNFAKLADVSTSLYSHLLRLSIIQSLIKLSADSQKLKLLFFIHFELGSLLYNVVYLS